MKKTLLTLFAAVFSTLALFAQNPELRYVDALELGLIGKAFDDTPNPYHRVDTEKYTGWTESEENLLHMTAGIIVPFRTDARDIYLQVDWGYLRSSASMMPVSQRGFDLYIKDSNGEFIFAAAAANRKIKIGEIDNIKVISDMDGTMHECLLYLPMYSEIKSLKIGVNTWASILPMDNPFRGRIVFQGSSFTQGVSTSRTAMSYPKQFERHTGLYCINLATSGRSRLQSYMADMLMDVEAEAFVFDTFSNPDSATIVRRLIPFIDKMVESHPGVPLIFQQTIYRERRNFNTKTEATERAKMNAVKEQFEKILSKPEYKDVYLIYPNASAAHESSVDGTHPDDYGYYLWAKSIEGPVLEILAKYGIK